MGCLCQCFSAECTTEGVTEPVLIKQLLPALSREPAVAASWLAIVEENTALQHPGCIKVLDYGLADGEAYMVLEHVVGASLRELLQRAQQSELWPNQEGVVAIAQAALEALSHGQEVGLAHLDLDPHALILQRDGNVVLTEFGMWRALPTASATRERFDKGRVAYLAPELVKAQEADVRSDVFSLGVILYELLARKRPFQGATQLVTAMMIAEGKRKPLRELAPQLSETLCDIVETMLAVSPDERFQSPRAALSALTATCVGDRHGVTEWVERLSLRAGPQDGASHSTAGAPPVSARAPGLAQPVAQLQPAQAVRDTAALPVRATPGSAATAPAPRGSILRSRAQGRASTDSQPLAPPPLVAPAAARPASIAAAREPGGEDWLAPPPLLSPSGPARGLSAAAPAADDPPVQVRDGKTAFLNRDDVGTPASLAPADRTSSGLQQAPAPQGPPFIAAGVSASSGLPPAQPAPPAVAAHSQPPLAFQAGHAAPLPSFEAGSFTPPAGGFRDFEPPAPVFARAPEGALRPRPVAPALQSRSDLEVSHGSTDQRWHEPSKTVFQMKRFAKSATQRGDARAPLYVIVLLAIAFGFALVAGVVLLWRLLS